LLVVLLLADSATAQYSRPVPGARGGAPAQEVPALLRDIAFAPPPDAVLPEGLRLRDSTGREVLLREALSRPAVLVPVYFDCPSLCGLATDGLLRALAVVGL